MFIVGMHIFVERSVEQGLRVFIEDRQHLVRRLADDHIAFV